MVGNKLPTLRFFTGSSRRVGNLLPTVDFNLQTLKFCNSVQQIQSQCRTCEVDTKVPL